jgi:hypothetical protein
VSSVLFSFFLVLALRLASDSPLAILLHQSFFLLQSFSLLKASHIKKPPTSKSQKPKEKNPSKNPKAKAPKQKTLHTPSVSLLSSGKQGGAAVLGEGPYIVTGETCVPSSLNINNLGEASVLHFLFLWSGLCQSWPTDKHLRKSS